MNKKRKTPVAIFISGRGSNMEALVKAAQADTYPARIDFVLSNKADAKGLIFARRHKIPTLIVDHKAHKTRESFEDAVLAALAPFEVELICLAGFMRLLTPHFLRHWKNRVLNIHPSLLPAFKGLHTHERALDAGVRFSGCTVHLVRPEMDDGPILQQAVVPIKGNDTPGRLAKRVLQQEHRIYPEALRLMAAGKAVVDGDVVRIRGARSPDLAMINPAPEVG